MSYGPFSTESFLFFWDESYAGYLADESHQCTPCNLPKYHIALSIDGNFSYLIFDNNHEPIIQDIQTTPHNPHKDLANASYLFFQTTLHSAEHFGIINNSFLSTMPLNPPVKLPTKFTVTELKEPLESKKRLKEEPDWSAINPRIYEQYPNIVFWEPRRYPLWFPHLFNLLIRIPFPPKVYRIRKLNQRAMLHALSQLKISKLCYSDDCSSVAVLNTPSTNIIPITRVLLSGIEMSDPLYSLLDNIPGTVEADVSYPEVHRILKQYAAKRPFPFYFKQEGLEGECLRPKAEITELSWHDFCVDYLNENKKGISILKENTARALAHMNETLDDKISQNQAKLVLMNKTKNYRIFRQYPHPYNARDYYRYVSSRRIFLQQLLVDGHMFKERETIDLLYRGISMPEPPLEATLKPYIAQAEQQILEYGVLLKPDNEKTLKDQEHLTEVHSRGKPVQYDPPFICWLFIWGNRSEPVKISLCLNDDFAYEPKELYLKHPTLSTAILDLNQQLFDLNLSLTNIKEDPTYSEEIEALPSYNYISSTTDSYPSHSWHLINDIILMNELPNMIIKFKHTSEHYMLKRFADHRFFLRSVLGAGNALLRDPADRLKTTPTRVLNYIAPMIIMDYNRHKGSDDETLTLIPSAQDKVTMMIQRLMHIYSNPHPKKYLHGTVVNKRDFIAHLRSIKPLSSHLYHYPWWVSKLEALPDTTPLTDIISAYSKKMYPLPVNNEALKFYQRAAWEGSLSVFDAPLPSD